MSFRQKFGSALHFGKSFLSVGFVAAMISDDIIAPRMGEIAFEFHVDKFMSEARISVKRNMTPTSNRLIVKWLPTAKVGMIHMPQSELDYWNTDSVKMFKVVAAGPGRTTRKGVFVPNEIKAGDNVILNCRTGGRPEPIGDNQFLVKNPDEVVIGVCPVQATGATASASSEC